MVEKQKKTPKKILSLKKLPKSSSNHVPTKPNIIIISFKLIYSRYDKFNLHNIHELWPLSHQRPLSITDHDLKHHQASGQFHSVFMCKIMRYHSLVSF